MEYSVPNQTAIRHWQLEWHSVHFKIKVYFHFLYKNPFNNLEIGYLCYNKGGQSSTP